MTREYPSLGHLVAHYVDLYLLTLGANGYFSMQLMAEHEKGPCEKYGLLSFSCFLCINQPVRRVRGRLGSVER